MNWKVFTTACVSVALLTVPQNIFSCGPTEDPHDYYTSFFSNRLGTGKELQPFYYTGLLTFYDQWEQDSVSYDDDKVLQEWMAYGNASKLQDAVELVYKSSAADVTQLLAGTVPTSLKTNSLARNLLKKPEALRYLQFAKKTAAIVPQSEWEDTPKRDSLQLNQWMTDASTAYAKATDAFLKDKYAFQVCKLAFYNHRYTGCVAWLDSYANGANRQAATFSLAQSYAAGSLYHMGEKKEAAYLFSRLFAASAQNKKQNYLGFWWASHFADASLIPDYTALGKNNVEKAALLGMFALYGVSYKLAEMQQVYALDPSSPLLPLLATREVNKLEESHLTPQLAKEKGGKALYINWGWREDEKKPDNTATQVKNTAAFFEKLLGDKALPNRGVYGAAAAYLHFITKDYTAAKRLLAQTAGAQPDEKTKEQTALINLLVAANEGGSITKEKEAQLLPSMKWLVQKAKTDAVYRPFCRNFFSEILAQRYEQQGDAARTALAYAMADLTYVSGGENDYYVYQPAIDFVRSQMTSEALLKLYEVMTTPATETETFFVRNGSVKRDAVIDVIGTSHLRDRNYAKAIEWLGKAAKPAPLVETEYNYQTGKERTVNADPFYDYLNDWQRYSKSLPAALNKLSLAKRLLEQQSKMQRIDTVADKARLYYTYASALYNLSYYGNAWSAVAYYRSTVDWNTGNYALPWQKEYFGVYEARTFYQKAYDAAANKEFKAACLFMVIKCDQRQIPRPEYDYDNGAASDKALAAFERKFRYNPLFARFQSEFGATRFYQYAYNRCSYLRDYVKRQPSPAGKR